MKHVHYWIVAAVIATSSSIAQGQGNTHADHSMPSDTAQPMSHEAMPGMDHGAMSDMEGMDMKEADTNYDSRSQGAPSPGVRDPHEYSGGYDFSEFPMRHEGDEGRIGSLRAERLEIANTDDNTFTVYDVQAWYGDSFDRGVLKAEGVIDDGELEETGTELLWSHAVASFWDAQLGVGYDGGPGPNRTWLAAGIQGLAPYWFELDITAYAGDHGRTALNVEAEYELLLTQRLILQPRIEAVFYGKDDSARGIGSGLSETTAGLRLRYELRREFAPYIGVEWENIFGDTADFARAAGGESAETRMLAGVRFWF